jgi:hypothetical protein
MSSVHLWTYHVQHWLHSFWHFNIKIFKDEWAILDNCSCTLSINEKIQDTKYNDTHPKYTCSYHTTISYQLVPLHIPLPTGRKNAWDILIPRWVWYKITDIPIRHWSTRHGSWISSHTDISTKSISIFLHDIINVPWSIGLHLVSTMVSILLASTLPGWYGLRQNQPDITTSQVWTWGNNTRCNSFVPVSIPGI